MTKLHPILGIIGTICSIGLVAQDCKVEIRKPSYLSDDQEIWINGKKAQDFLRGATVDQPFLYKGKKYIPVKISSSGGGGVDEEYLILSCEKSKLISRFMIKSIVYGYKNKQSYIKYRRDWKADFEKLVLIDLKDNSQVPMTVDSDQGFFPIQQCCPETEEEENPPPPPKTLPSPQVQPSKAGV